MWPVLVVVAAVDAEHVFEVAASEDGDAVEAVGANGAYPTLGEGVCVRRLDWRADQLDALRLEDLVEGVAELRVAIVDEGPEGMVFAELHGEVARLLVTQRPSGLELQARYSIGRVASEMTKRT